MSSKPDWIVFLATQLLYIMQSDRLLFISGQREVQLQGRVTGVWCQCTDLHGDQEAKAVESTGSCSLKCSHSLYNPAQLSSLSLTFQVKANQYALQPCFLCLVLFVLDMKEKKIRNGAINLSFFYAQCQHSRQRQATFTLRNIMLNYDFCSDFIFFVQLYMLL